MNVRPLAFGQEIYNLARPTICTRHTCNHFSLLANVAGKQQENVQTVYLVLIL